MSTFQQRVKQYLSHEQNREESLKTRAAFFKSAAEQLMDKIERCLTPEIPLIGLSSIEFSKTSHDVAVMEGFNSKDLQLAGLEIRVLDRSANVVPQRGIRDELTVKVSARNSENVFCMTLGYGETQWAICRPDQDDVLFTDELFDELIAKAMFE